MRVVGKAPLYTMKALRECFFGDESEMKAGEGCGQALVGAIATNFFCNLFEKIRPKVYRGEKICKVFRKS